MKDGGNESPGKNNPTNQIEKTGTCHKDRSLAIGIKSTLLIPK